MTNAQTEAEVSATVSGDLGLSFLDGKTDAHAVVGPDPFVEELLERARTFLPDGPRPGPLRRAWLRVVRAFVAARRTAGRVARRVVAAALAHAAHRADVVAYARRYRRRELIDWRGRTYRVGRHRAARRWFGRQRSTSERCRANAAECRRAAKEADLPRVPLEYVSWAASWIETLREERAALHPQHRTEFTCS